MAGARARRGRMPKGNGSALAASAVRHGAAPAARSVKQAPNGACPRPVHTHNVPAP